MTMAAAWLIVAGIAVGLPAVAWGFSRNLKPPRQPMGRPMRTASWYDRWLFECYQLGVLDRGKVVEAVFVKGQLPSEPALRDPARGLAAEVLRRRLPFPRPRWFGFGYLVCGVGLCTVGLVERFSSHTGGFAGVLYISEGVVFMAALGPMWLLIPRRMRRKAQEVLATSASSEQGGLS